MTRMTMKCTEMSCGHCSGTIEKELGKLPGMTKVAADPKSKDVEVEFSAPCTWEEIKKTLIAHEFPPADEQILS
eukprot:CAMPEP_0206253636 /NCGR_PEP_ID=MMETSP0047_2-20121206/23259_1 /ASSEMBLY_ACC=CAM_ASM_000192 /TAXON_ID=195065 /ORGANISM="Chroomonas mesostigmatica_cf, Strain CCMP1168" /LENGTH=73 /DNA_ID=CAMNT_0053679861 /DNA_START=47 /DNA_END=268 /DNA_ORIENTATION=+